MFFDIHWRHFLHANARRSTKRYIPFACSLFCILPILISSVLTTSPTSSLAAPVTAKAKNADLLSFKMFLEFENEELNKPTEISTVGPMAVSVTNSFEYSGRVQRHIPTSGKPRRHRKRKRRMRTEGHRPLPKENNTAPVVAFKQLKTDASFSLGYAPSHLSAQNGRGFCKTVPFTQWINITGCVPKRIPNAYCYGACNSFYIPSDGLQFPPFTSYQFCTPKRTKWVNVEILCGIGAEVQNVRTTSEDDNQIMSSETLQHKYQPLSTSGYRKVYKKVQIVTKCRCQSKTLDVRG